MRKYILSIILISSLVLNGCDYKKKDKSVPDFMPAEEYTGQGYNPNSDDKAMTNPPVTKKDKKFLKENRTEFEKLVKQFYKKNFDLNVKITNIKPLSRCGVRVFFHCNDKNIVFDSFHEFDKSDLNNKKKALKVNDEYSENLVMDVISGFEYRAQKEKYDNLFRYLAKNKNKYHYTGYTKEALRNTIGDGYENEYFNISGYPVTIEEYHQYFEPLLYLNQKDFKNNYENAKKLISTDYKNTLRTNLFSKRKDYTRHNNHSTVLKMAKEIKSRKKYMPEDTEIHLEFQEDKLETKQPYWGNMNPTSYGIFTEVDD